MLLDLNDALLALFVERRPPAMQAPKVTRVEGPLQGTPALKVARLEDPLQVTPGHAVTAMLLRLPEFPNECSVPRGINELFFTTLLQQLKTFEGVPRTASGFLRARSPEDVLTELARGLCPDRFAIELGDKHVFHVNPSELGEVKNTPQTLVVVSPVEHPPILKLRGAVYQLKSGVCKTGKGCYTAFDESLFCPSTPVLLAYERDSDAARTDSEDRRTDLHDVLTHPDTTQSNSGDPNAAESTQAAVWNLLNAQQTQWNPFLPPLPPPAAASTHEPPLSPHAASTHGPPPAGLLPPETDVDALATSFCLDDPGMDVFLEQELDPPDSKLEAFLAGLQHP